MDRALPLFIQEVSKFYKPRILEIGSRKVTHTVLRDRIPIEYEYIGLDIHPGENVDVVGDAHNLSNMFPANYFDAVMTKAVFEHLAMPWKVMIELNKVMKQSGLLFIHTHSCFPLHERPWDFWRYSRDTWNILLNRVTGFNIIVAEEEFPCKIIPDEKIAQYNENHSAFLNTNVLASKICDYDSSRLKWDINILEATGTIYPIK